MIYNLADTFFIGQTGEPLMVAAVSLVSPWFNLLTALGNLFGLGGNSLISRMLGVQREGEIRYVSSFSIWAGAAVTACFSLASFLAREPLLTFLGASVDNYGYAEDYLLWVVAVGGVPTMVSLALGHLLRSDGMLPLHRAHTAFFCHPALRLYRLSKSQRGNGVVSLSK